MPEIAFLEAVAGFLRGPAALVPAPALVGVADPVAADEMPAISLALPAVQRLGGTAGGGIEPMSGALPVEARIDLGAPFLPIVPDFSLVGGDRRDLILPHGGLVRADGTEGSLGAEDIEVTVDGTPRPIAAPPPVGDQVSVDAVEGRLHFATPLPGAGIVVARYHLGLWERQTILLQGRLELVAHASAASDAERLGTAAVRALLGATIPGLRQLALESLRSIGPPDAALANARARRAGFRFEYAHVVDEPASAGGIIRRIPLSTTLRTLRMDRVTGTLVGERVTEPARRSDQR